MLFKIVINLKILENYLETRTLNTLTPVFSGINSIVVLSSYPYKFISGYLYFPNDLKDIQDHIQLQNPFPINGNSFERKPELIANPYILQ